MAIDWAGFRVYLEKQRLSAGSIKQYLYQAKTFEQLVNMEEASVDKLFEDINNFVQRGRTTFSLFALKHLFVFLGKRELWLEYFQLHGRHIKPKPRRIIYKAMSFKEIEAVREHLIPPFNVALSLQYEGCLRVAELLSIRKKDINRHQDAVKLSIVAKGGQPIIVTILNADCIKMIERLIEGMRDEEKLFRFNDDTYNLQLKAASIKAFGEIGSSVSSHWIRHSRGMDVWEKSNKDVLAVMKVMRHKRLETTYTYLMSMGLIESEVMEKARVSWS